MIIKADTLLLVGFLTFIVGAAVMLFFVIRKDNARWDAGDATCRPYVHVTSFEENSHSYATCLTQDAGVEVKPFEVH